MQCCAGGCIGAAVQYRVRASYMDGDGAATQPLGLLLSAALLQSDCVRSVGAVIATAPAALSGAGRGETDSVLQVAILMDCLQ
jgi:hypothetical protein